MFHHPELLVLLIIKNAGSNPVDITLLELLPVYVPIFEKESILLKQYATKLAVPTITEPAFIVKTELVGLVLSQKFVDVPAASAVSNLKYLSAPKSLT